MILFVPSSHSLGFGPFKVNLFQQRHAVLRHACFGPRLGKGFQFHALLIHPNTQGVIVFVLLRDGGFETKTCELGYRQRKNRVLADDLLTVTKFVGIIHQLIVALVPTMNCIFGTIRCCPIQFLFGWHFVGMVSLVLRCHGLAASSSDLFRSSSRMRSIAVN